ncbi:MAG: FprA family A-type flavoprotein, partial [Eubacterium sp.]
IITTEKAAMFMHQFGFSINDHLDEVAEGDTRCFGKHTVTFVAAPMVHWPEAMVTFDLTDGILFAADAFGSFCALDGKLFNDEVNYDRDWIDEARRYYTNIVGKYGPFVQKLLAKAGTIDIKMICPLHGLVWRSDLGYIIEKYDKWSRYEPEEKGVVVAYASMYGNTETAANIIAQKLVERGVTNVVVYDVSKTHKSYLISDVFKYSHLVLASVTYNLGIFPPMHEFLMDMKALNLQKRTVGIIENGSWACKSGSLMSELLDQMKEMTVLDDTVTLTSSLNDMVLPEMDTLADAIVESMKGE